MSAAADLKTADAAPVLLTQPEAGIVRLTLNRPRAYNSLSTGMMAALQAELDAVKADRNVKAVIIAANGPGFCAGHDLKEVRANPGRPQYEALFRQCSMLMQSIVALPQPVIAQVHGVASAAGCQLVASCDLAVAAETARFATPGVNIGLFCSTPMVALSRNVSRKHAMEMLLTGDLLPAGRAAEIGLVNRVVPEGALAETALVLARQIAAKSPLTVKIGKEAFYRQLDMPLAQAYDYASRVMTENMLARDAEEGIDAFIEKREPRWEGR
ncbi:MAG: enoyl-CoA hydratase [Ferrovibrio sp.]|uniref:enoyl-CoA hydratase n=1 Tax=Ferrovibrio sp. TaxID=1917215 RepID=UPI002632B938|nr:enoyl-CoA hydratase [Ferrovibrio sp.]MCW0233405.1 enoyl-CoA hydratase [Ferrovibrio sp.]